MSRSKSIVFLFLTLFLFANSVLISISYAIEDDANHLQTGTVVFLATKQLLRLQNTIPSIASFMAANIASNKTERVFNVNWDSSFNLMDPVTILPSQVLENSFSLWITLFLECASLEGVYWLRYLLKGIQLVTLCCIVLVFLFWFNGEGKAVISTVQW